ncbi:Wadjet anti-phage system protein JetD domain-containing protein [Caldibacillus thermoamylovorans]
MEQIEKRLAAFPKRTISLVELERLTEPFARTYEAFAEIVLRLEADGTLEMVKAKGRTTRTPSLAFQYRIHKHRLMEDYYRELQRWQNRLHPAIQLDAYYGKDPSVWERDKPFIVQIDDYLNTHSLPHEAVAAPERSMELVGDEKWITEGGGREVLERIGLFDRLRIIPVSDPLMFAVHPGNMAQAVQLHLIVENKTTYQALLPALLDTVFSTLIYGKGKTVISSIAQFSLQYPVKADHRFYYFGDIDREGVAIWHSLFQKKPALPALPFYRACLQKEPARGKEYQIERTEALASFLSYFAPDERERLCELLASGRYYPQETLKTRELQHIWREWQWTS